MRFIVKAPKATTVRHVAVQPGSFVRRGDPILVLDDLDEQKVMSRLEREISELRARLDEVAANVVEVKVARLHKIVRSKAEAIESSKRYLWAKADLVKQAKVSHFEFLGAHQDVSLRKYHLLQASIEKQAFEKHAENTREILTSVISSYNCEVKYVASAAKRLNVSSPRDGRVKHNLYPGFPVGRGQILCEID